MKRFTLYIVCVALFFASNPVQAGFKSFLKKALPPQEASPNAPPESKPNRTQSLIGGGLNLIKSLQPIGYNEEMAIGGAVALEAVARFGGLWENKTVEDYVVTTGRAVASTSDRPEIPYYFGILNTEEPNAFACPGGYIFVSKGLLKLVKSEAQLAGVLGHEIAHVAKKHALESIRRSQILSSMTEVTLSALDKDPKMFDSIVKETTSMILERGLDQQKELEADEVGTAFAFRVGYNPEGLRAFLQELEKVSGKSNGGVFKTHPKTSDRLARINRELSRPDYAGSQSLPLLTERLNQTFKGVVF